MEILLLDAYGARRPEDTPRIDTLSLLSFRDTEHKHVCQRREISPVDPSLSPSKEGSSRRSHNLHCSNFPRGDYYFLICHSERSEARRNLLLCFESPFYLGGDSSSFRFASFPSE